MDIGGGGNIIHCESIRSSYNSLYISYRVRWLEWPVGNKRLAGICWLRCSMARAGPMRGTEEESLEAPPKKVACVVGFKCEWSMPLLDANVINVACDYWIQMRKGNM